MGRPRVPTTRSFREYNRIFRETYGDGPWTCVVCDGVIEMMGRGRGLGNIHHLDDDFTNNAPDNLAAIHHDCHSAEHPITPEIRDKISQTLKGRPSPTKGTQWSEERRRHHQVIVSGDGNPFYGKNHSEETKAKMRRPRKRVRCGDCGKDWAVNWAQRHKDDDLCSS